MAEEACYSSGDEYEETEENQLGNIGCLFCGHEARSHEALWQHTQSEHQLDLVGECRRAQLDCFQFIKLVNYVRKSKCQASAIGEVISGKQFDAEEYLKPVIEDDQLLMFDYDDDNEDEPKESIDYKAEFLKLKEQLAKAEAKCSEMQKFIQSNLVNDDEEGGDVASGSGDHPKVTNLDEANDQSYIDSYSHFGIHHEMLADKPRTLAYQDAIIENAQYFKDKTILDIGCGTGILSLFAAKAGARLVVAVDQSDIVYNAMEIVFDNQMDSVVRPIKGKLETIDFAGQGLPTKYDIIISEWMGYFLLFEGMIDTVLYARDHLLAPGGILLPNRCQLFMAAASDSNFYERNIDFWTDVYGFRMGSMVKHVAKEVAIEPMASQNICSTTKTIAKLDMTQCSAEEVQLLTSPIDFNFSRDTTVHVLVGWFDCYFDSLQKSVVLSTSPNAEPTHWKQAIFPLVEPISVRAGETIKGTITIKRDKLRCLSVHLNLDSLQLSLAYNIA